MASRHKGGTPSPRRLTYIFRPPFVSPGGTRVYEICNRDILFRFSVDAGKWFLYHTSNAACVGRRMVDCRLGGFPSARHRDVKNGRRMTESRGRPWPRAGDYCARRRSAAPGRNQNLLARRRGGAEKGMIKLLSSSASPFGRAQGRLCASARDIVPSVGRAYSSFVESTCQKNKANSRHEADREIGVPGGSPCETKPIWEEFELIPASPGTFWVFHKSRTYPLSPVFPEPQELSTKANSYTIKFQVSGFKLEKQMVGTSKLHTLHFTLGRRPFVRNKANLPPGRCRAGRPTHEEPRGNRAKQSQFGPAGTGRRRTKDAKRTQFPATPGGPGPQGRGTRGQMCETKPKGGRPQSASGRRL